MKGAFVVVVLLVLCLGLSASAEVWHPQPNDLLSFLGLPTLPDVSWGPGFTSLRNTIISKIISWAEAFLLSHPPLPAPNENPYFGFVPAYVGSAVPDSQGANWTAPCFKSNKATATTNKDGTITVSITSSEKTSWTCYDMYLLGTVTGLSVQVVALPGTHNVRWTLPADVKDSEKWDLGVKGVRLFRFLGDIPSTISDVLSTVQMFEPLLTQGVAEAAAARNLDFATKYMGVTMGNRTITEVALNESDIHSGDFLGVIRLDGLDPMLGWAMGSTTGHTTVALWFPDGLYICESTTKDSYWPTNGIQRTPYRQWLALAKAAGHNVVLAPLAPEMRAKFNESAAQQFFFDHEGVNYGFPAMFFGWIDTLEDNYPCLPDNSACLRWEHFEIVLGLADRVAPSIASLFVKEGLNHRMNTTGLGVADVYQAAGKAGISSETLMGIVEQDSWLYNMSRYGNSTVMSKAMVCCVFVCNIWKSAGIFSDLNDDVNCGEFTNWDDYSMSIFDKNYVRPDACVQADPHNPLCQIEGQYSLQLAPTFNSKAPFAHMAEHCPSEGPPAYSGRDSC